MKFFENVEQYTEECALRAVLPSGFKAASVPLSFFPREKEIVNPFTMNLSLILLDNPTESFGGLLTSNAFPGHPVVLARELLTAPRSRGVFINNKIANVCSPGGLEDCRRLLKSLSGLAGIGEGELFAASTGIIGWKLPVPEMEQALPQLIENLDSSSVLSAARGIMTTDSFVKVRRAEAGAGTIVGIAKGAGMIEPNLATMLVFLFTDCEISRAELREHLRNSVRATFNRITIDGDQSTSDMVLVFSSGKKPKAASGEFARALSDVCGNLAEDIVRNGEGIHHVIKITVTGAPEEGPAAAIARRIANSPLVKTAVFGNDPNVGRIIMALGDQLGKDRIPFDREKIKISFGNETVFKNGSFVIDRDLEKRLSGYMEDCYIDPGKDRFPRHEKTVDIGINLGKGNAEASVTGSDLSYDYVKENADYRT